MSSGSPRGRIAALLDRWNDEPRARSRLVALAAVISALAYVVWLGQTYPLREWLLWQVAVLWAWSAYLSLACVSAGYLVLTRAARIGRLPTLETLVLSAAAGLVVFVMGMYAGGFLRLYHPIFAVLLPAVMITSGARPLLAFARERRAQARADADPPDRRARVVHIVSWVFGVVCVALVYLGAFTPAAINFDAAWSHVPIAVDYARAGRIIRFDGDYTRNFPHLASLVHTWAMIVPAFRVLTEPPLRWMLVLHLEFVFFLWTLAGVGAMAAWLRDRERLRGAWAGFFLFPAIFVYDMNLGGASDHYLAFFAVPFFLAAMRAAPRFDARTSGLAGAFAAAALLTKYQAIYLLFGVGSVYAASWIRAAYPRIRGRAADTAPPWAELVRGPLALALVFVLVTSPHFLKNWVFYGNPLYPFAQDIFRSHPTTPNAAYLFEWLFKDYEHRPHGGLFYTIAEALGLLWSHSFAPHYSFSRGIPNGGSLFTFGLILAVLGKAPKRIWIGFAAGLAALFAWGMIFRVDRHLQTFMPLLAATTAAVLSHLWEVGAAARAGISALVAAQVITTADAPFSAGADRLGSALGLIRSGYEKKAKTRFDGFRADDRAVGATLPESARVLLHMHRTNLGLDRDTVLDWAGQQALIFVEGARGPRALYDIYRAAGVTHLLWIPGDRPAMTKHEEVLFAELTHRHVIGRRRFGIYETSALPASPPPPDRPYRVLALGLTGYEDGLYPVEAMKTYELVPEHREVYPKPHQPLPRSPAAIGSFVGSADAVCLADGWKGAPAVKDKVQSSFDPVVTYPGRFSVHLRKVKPLSG